MAPQAHPPVIGVDIGDLRAGMEYRLDCVSPPNILLADLQRHRHCNRFAGSDSMCFRSRHSWSDCMQVQIIHQQANGARTDYGFQEMESMPPVGEPFPVDKQVYYTTKAYFGPDEDGRYLLVLEGEPRLLS